MSPPSTTLTVRTSVAMVAELDALAARLTGEGSTASGRMTRTAAARLALKRGIESLQAECEPGPALPHFPEPDVVEDATEAIELLALLDLGRLEPDSISALGALDVDVLRALRRLDVDVLDALCTLDTVGIDALERLAGLDDRLERIIDRYEEPPCAGGGRCARACTEARG